MTLDTRLWRLQIRVEFVIECCLTSLSDRLGGLEHCTLPLLSSSTSIIAVFPCPFILLLCVFLVLRLSYFLAVVTFPFFSFKMLLILFVMAYLLP